MSKIHRVDQGSAEWYKLRLGIPTASMFHKIVTPGGKESTQARAYMYRLIAERLLRDTMDQMPYVEWAERGKVVQPQAEQQFELVNEVKLEPGGFVTTDDGRLGCSPDALVMIKGVPCEPVEIKCPAPWTQIGYLLDGPGNDYKPQVQGQLYVGAFDLAHFYAYHPQMPAAHVQTERDQKFMKTMADLLERFLDTLDKDTERARSLGAYVVTTTFESPLERGYPELSAPGYEIKLP
jgi:hypothetical protein